VEAVGHVWVLWAQGLFPPQNLMSEYHIRYGGYGGIGYYLVADSYIALFSRFSTCGAWEGHYILDFIEENNPMSGPIPSTPTPKVKAPPFLVWRICWGSS
jgi:Tn3 transposase DDE domain